MRERAASQDTFARVDTARARPRQPLEVADSLEPLGGVYEFSLESAPLKEGVLSYLKQVPVVSALFYAEELVDVQGGAVRGTMSASEGMSMLLAGTGCRAQWSDVQDAPLALIRCHHQEPEGRNQKELGNNERGEID